MSRALDEDVAASTKANDSQTVYNDLIAVLSSNMHPKLLEIEFLWKGYPMPPGTNILTDENFVGIPKSKLIQAFIVARQIFFKCVHDISSDHAQEIQDSTSVLLLTDPEHLTAANARKRLIQQIRGQRELEVEAALKKELYFIDSLLTSRLTRHTKSPTLWGHRRWLLEIRQSIGIEPVVLRHLTSVVMVAADRHPHNYYAWSHMRWIMSFVEGWPVCEASRKDMGILVSDVKKWCMRNTADTSGWSFLLFCLSPRFKLHGLQQDSENEVILREVLRMAKHLRLSGESMWVFLRTLAAGLILEDDKKDFLETVESVINSFPEGYEIPRVILEARDWYFKYDQKLD